MPVTTKPASHGPSAWIRESDLVDSDHELLKRSCPDEFRMCLSIEQSSFGSGSAVYPSSNGFVRGAIDAYSHHNHLVVRPEDVWFSILTQLNLFINKNAEDLRSMFVTHQGQEELEVMDSSFNAPRLITAMTYKLERNIADPSLREWMMPNFTTTTDTDRVVASIILLGTLQKYFSYIFTIVCGLPSVTLLGSKADWELILARVERIPQFGPEPVKWYQLLKPVLKRFVGTFDSPDSLETKDFWQKIAHYSRGGSGPNYLSGWITAFCFWGERGESVLLDEPPHLTLDGVNYCQINTNDIPPGFVSAPVKVNNFSDVFNAVMVAGSVGLRITSSGELLSPTGRVGLDTMQPESGWWIFRRKGKEEQEQDSDGEEPPPYSKVMHNRDAVLGNYGVP